MMRPEIKLDRVCPVRQFPLGHGATVTTILTVEFSAVASLRLDLVWNQHTRRVRSRKSFGAKIPATNLHRPLLPGGNWFLLRARPVRSVYYEDFLLPKEHTHGTCAEPYAPIDAPAVLGVRALCTVSET